MTNRVKHTLLIALAALVVFGIAAANLLLPSERYSLSERRTLAQMPELSSADLRSGRFMSEFETYTQDQFPLRDGFRRLKALTARYLFRQKDNHGLYVENGYLSKLDFPADQAAMDRNTQKLRELYDRYLAGTDCKLYFSVIPDKNAFLAPLGGYPSMDYPVVIDTLYSAVDFATPIRLDGLLTLEDFYYTDQHWRQECIPDVAQALADGMGADIAQTFTEQVLDVPFYGAYVGQSALPFDPDELHYLTGDIIDDCIVTSYNSGMAAPAAMYDFEKAGGKDAYDLFLGGADPLLIIENPHAATDRELIVFRDSFGSSIAPLLTAGYAKITLVDLRYIRSDVLGHFLTFDNQDVLLLYSTLVLNNAISM